jgi:hypothetical protein
LLVGDEISRAAIVGSRLNNAGVAVPFQVTRGHAEICVICVISVTAAAERCNLMQGRANWTLLA